MRGIIVALTICAVAAVVCGPALGVDLLNGSDNVSEFRIGLYSPHGSGSMDDVREFDGRTLNPGSLEYLESLGYSGPWQYGVMGRWLFDHDIDGAVDLSYKNRFGLSYYTSTLTHRLQARRDGDIALVAATPGTDLSPNTNFAIVRTVNDVNMRFMDSSQTFRLMADFWQQTKDGTGQFIGRWNTGTGNRKHVIALPVDSDTNQTTVGTDVRIGNAAVINYRYSDTKFGQDPTPITTNATPKHPTVVGSDTKTSAVKARATINDRLYFTGFHITRQRINNRVNVSMSSSATNAALTYLATDSLTLTARYRMSDQDSHTDPVLSGGSIVNSALSTNLSSSSIEASYTGIPHAFLKAGYERRNVSRSTQLTSDAFAEMEPSSKADIVTGSLRYYPTSNLSISAYGLINNTDTAGYAGTPNKQKSINANATYMLGDNLALYGDFSSLKEHNNLVRVPLASIPSTGTPTANEELRIAAAGQGYDNDQTTGTLGAWYSLNTKLVLDANYSRIRTNVRNLWILGVDASAANNTVPNMVSFDTLNNQWSTGLTYSMSPRWSFYGRYILSNSDGRGVLDPSLYPPGVGPTWLPVDIHQHTYVLGFAHQLSAKDRLMLDFSVEEYVDHLNAKNTGTFDIWRLAWSHQF